MAANKDYNGYWFFWGNVEGKFYFYEDMVGYVAKEDVGAIDLGILLYEVTGDFKQIPQKMRDQVDYQKTMQEVDYKNPSKGWVAKRTGNTVLFYI